MKRLFYLSLVMLAMAVTSCESGGTKKSDATVMATSVDSMSYAYGMELGRMLNEVDSALNIDMVCKGISDVYNRSPKLSVEEARYAVLKYKYYDNYERIKRYEDQFLKELRTRDREYHATASGLTYKIANMGDTKRGPKSNRDTMRIMYRVLDGSRVVDTTYYHHDTLRIAYGDVPKGVQEAARLVGRGGHVEAWLPSTLAFGSAGCDSLGVEPNTMLYYEIKVIDVEKR